MQTSNFSTFASAIFEKVAIIGSVSKSQVSNVSLFVAKM